jgi:hypothetical protein
MATFTEAILNSKVTLVRPEGYYFKSVDLASGIDPTIKDPIIKDPIIKPPENGEIIKPIPVGDGGVMQTVVISQEAMQPVLIAIGVLVVMVLMVAIVVAKNNK